jgi:histone arginine demethylase JMJD6
MQLADRIDRRSGLSPERFDREYLRPPRPVIMTNAISHWSALGRWSPKFFKYEYGHLEIELDGETMALGALIDRIEASTDDSPAPYLRNQPLADWPPELLAEVLPMPNCTRPNWLESRVFPSRQRMTYPEVYIGGQGARFPVLHYDGLHTHAFLMQLHGEKEYIVFSPDQTAFVYPQNGDSNTSRIDDVLQPDLATFPLFDQAEGTRFQLHPGETLFVPAGWWHTARILSPSVTVSINCVNRANSVPFRRDYCAAIASRSPLLARAVSSALVLGGRIRIFEFL